VVSDIGNAAIVLADDWVILLMQRSKQRRIMWVWPAAYRPDRTSSRSHPMSHPLTILAVTSVVLLALDIAALRWGVDSRFSHRADEDVNQIRRNW
jgi:hypothetical protein